MAGYEDPVLPDDDPSEDAFVAGVLTDFGAEVPTWEASSGDPVVPVLTVGGRMVHELRDLVRTGYKAMFAAFGRTVINLPSSVEAPATLTADIDFGDDTNGHTIAAGTTVTWTDPATDQLLEFEVVSQVTIGVGVSVAPVTLRALFPGTEFNEVPDGAPLVLTEALAGAVSVTATTAADGGVDPEPVDEYVDKLADELGTLHVAVSNERDAMVLARRVPGVHRAYALDGWDPDTNTVDTDIANLDVGIVFLDEAGQDVDDEVADAALAYLSSDDVRTVNVELKRGHPTYTDVAVIYAATCDPNFDPDTVKAAADQAVRDLLDPALWSGGRAEPPEWRGDKVVFVFDVVATIGRVPGINQVQSLTLNGGTSNVTLAGRAALPSPFEVGGSTVTGTVEPA